jgi:hypothetical protein
MAQTLEATRTQPTDPAHYAESSARENLIEHVFLGEHFFGLVALLARRSPPWGRR